MHAAAGASLGASAPAVPMSSAPPGVLAVAYHGAYDRWGTRRLAIGCSDFFLDAENHRLKLFEPLRQHSGFGKLLTFFHTYRSRCAEKDSALVSYLQPADYEFSSRPLAKIIDSYLRVLLLVLAWDATPEAIPAGRVRAVVLCRFDAYYEWPVTMLPIDWHKINLAWRDEPGVWAKERKVSDLFFALPTRHVRLLMRALLLSGDKMVHGPGHWIYSPIAAEHGDAAVNFLQNYTYSSSLVHLGVRRRREETLMLLIDRRCDGLQFDECVSNTSSSTGLGSCWRGIQYAMCGVATTDEQTADPARCLPKCNAPIPRIDGGFKALFGENKRRGAASRRKQPATRA